MLVDGHRVDLGGPESLIEALGLGLDSFLVCLWKHIDELACDLFQCFTPETVHVPRSRTWIASPNGHWRNDRRFGQYRSR